MCLDLEVVCKCDFKVYSMNLLYLLKHNVEKKKRKSMSECPLPIPVNVVPEDPHMAPSHISFRSLLKCHFFSKP